MRQRVSPRVDRHQRNNADHACPPRQTARVPHHVPILVRSRGAARVPTAAVRRVGLSARKRRRLQQRPSHSSRLLCSSTHARLLCAARRRRRRGGRSCRYHSPAGCRRVRAARWPNSVGARRRRCARCTPLHSYMARAVGACVVHLDCGRARAALCRHLRRGDGGGGALLAIDAGHVFDAVVCQAHAVRDAPLGAVDQELASEVLREYAQRLADLLALDDDAGARSPPALRLVHAHDEPIARAHLSSIDAIMLHATLEAARRPHRAFAVASVAHRVFCRRRWCSLE